MRRPAACVANGGIDIRQFPAIVAAGKLMDVRLVRSQIQFPGLFDQILAERGMLALADEAKAK
jgi:hypothetical protein